MNPAAESASELRYRRLFEAAYDGILILDPATRTILDANPYLSRLLGYTREELLGRELFEIGLLKDEAANRAAMTALRTGGYIRYDDLPLKTKDGRSTDVEFISNVYQEGDRQVIQCNIRDISARRRTELKLQEIAAQRERLGREMADARDTLQRANESKDRFLAILSHELRTPLNPVLLFAGEAADDPAMPPAAREIFRFIVRNVELETRLIDDLLDMTRIAHGKLALVREVVDVHGALRNAVEIVQADLGAKQIGLRLNFRAEARYVAADPVRLQQVFWNVLRNAAKFSEVGGQIEIETSDPRPGVIEIKIVDGGIGMTDAELKRIFTAFAQGDHAGEEGSRRYGGLGLGLAISKTLVEMHAGTIRAESAGRHRGSTIRIELPIEAAGPPATRLQPEAPVPQFVAPPEKPARAGPPRLLLVEDHEPTRTALTQLLVRRRFHVVPVGTAAEARAVAARQVFDLLLSDVGLADGSGHELMTEFHERFGLRGIALSGGSSEQEIAHGRKAGFVAHLIKPVSVEALEAALAATLPYH
jgi:PAS domain S-box-containing protein